MKLKLIYTEEGWVAFDMSMVAVVAMAFDMSMVAMAFDMSMVAVVAVMAMAFDMSMVAMQLPCLRRKRTSEFIRGYSSVVEA